MTNARGQEMDKTHLSLDQAEERGFIHRDYLAHCLRWSHIIKYLYKSRNYENATILDIGCGKELPLAKLLYSNRIVPHQYIGIDLNKLEIPKMLQTCNQSGTFIPYLHGEFDAANIVLMPDNNISINNIQYSKPNIIVAFEVLEHIEPKHVIKLLNKLYEIMNKDTVLFISTPNFNGSAANNHVNEMTHDCLKNLFSILDFKIEENYGTFASQREIEPKIKHLDIHKVYEQLKLYYDSNVLSCLFAPLFPKQSRNSLWILKQENHDSNILPWKNITIPWSSSDKWRDFENA